jgi:hypothetical protein
MSRLRCRSIGVAIAIAALGGLVPARVFTSPQAAAGAPQLKAAFLLNFARFTEWPAIAADAPLVLCVMGDDLVLEALGTAARGQRVAAHQLQVTRLVDQGLWKGCHLIFVGGTEQPRTTALLDAIRTAPILTVSDRTRFAESSGMIELFPKDGRMGFAVNVDALQRVGIRVSSRLLALARIVRSPPQS